MNIVQEHTTPGGIALTYPHRGLRIIASHWPAPAELPQFCSCGEIACPTPPPDRTDVDGR
jgi:hypothetical protein